MVTLKYPHVVPITQYCEVEETRRIVEKHFNSRCKAENTPILERLIGLRHERAQVWGRGLLDRLLQVSLSAWIFYFQFHFCIGPNPSTSTAAGL